MELSIYICKHEDTLPIIHCNEIRFFSSEVVVEWFYNFIIHYSFRYLHLPDVMDVLLPIFWKHSVPVSRTLTQNIHLQYCSLSLINADCRPKADLFVVPVARLLTSLRGLASIPAWISNHVSSKVWYEISYPMPNFNSYTTEVSEWISNFIPQITMDVITYPWWTQIIVGMGIFIKAWSWCPEVPH